MFQPRIGIMYRCEAIQKRLLDCQIVKSSNLLITPGGNWDKIHCIVNEYSYMIKISFCAKTKKSLWIKIPVGFPSSSHRMSPPSTFSGRLFMEVQNGARNPVSMAIDATQRYKATFQQWFGIEICLWGKLLSNLYAGRRTKPTHRSRNFTSGHLV